MGILQDYIRYQVLIVTVRTVAHIATSLEFTRNALYDVVRSALTLLVGGAPGGYQALLSRSFVSVLTKTATEHDRCAVVVQSLLCTKCQLLLSSESLEGRGTSSGRSLLEWDEDATYHARVCLPGPSHTPCCVAGRNAPIFHLRPNDRQARGTKPHLRTLEVSASDADEDSDGSLDMETVPFLSPETAIGGLEAALCPAAAGLVSEPLPFVAEESISLIWYAVTKGRRVGIFDSGTM